MDNQCKDCKHYVPCTKCPDYLRADDKENFRCRWLRGSRQREGCCNRDNATVTEKFYNLRYMIFATKCRHFEPQPVEDNKSNLAQNLYEELL